MQRLVFVLMVNLHLDWTNHSVHKSQILHIFHVFDTSSATSQSGAVGDDSLTDSDGSLQLDENVLKENVVVTGWQKWTLTL